ncbi:MULTISPECIES: iron-sulfur cluster assembly protein [Marinifilum]|jgi:Predicted metal-sulfur cluster biosynthetic enzyme|uniref:iron-sulfur cluster assembly protein n=1 Tax=Marinifilum TaxID=866673 RepID=UPI0006D0ABAF|nr:MULTISPECIES: iron-sulfur cluster assembly protein [Marinifilum]MDQ2180769.1 iron-sulfur cluster assembly protein [Marinifilum sp. D714]
MGKKETEGIIVEVLKTIYDPEIPVNIYDLGLIYEIDFYEEDEVKVLMTLTAPNCPMADQILEEVNDKIKALPMIEDVTVVLTFDPPWDKDMMTEEAKLELGFL